MAYFRVLGVLVVATRLLSAGVVMELSGWQEQPRPEPDRAGQVRRVRTASFGLGPATYGVNYRATYKADDPAFLDLGEGPVGLLGPVKPGWYEGGFIVTTLNGQRLDSVPLSSFIRAEWGERAIADLVWHHPAADLRYRFAGLLGQDHLVLQIDWEPKVEVKSFEVKLIAYPSFFTGWEKRTGARRTELPGGLVPEGKTGLFAADEGWYALLYDEVFDPARGEGSGPCAVALLPDGVQQVRVEPRGYASYVTLLAEPGARRLRLAFWKFADEPNATVRARFPATAAATREVLASLDLTPRSLRGFDFAELDAVAARAAVDGPVRKALGSRLPELREWLDQTRSAAGGEPTIAGSEAFLDRRERFEELLWEARLAELLDF